MLHRTAPLFLLLLLGQSSAQGHHSDGSRLCKTNDLPLVKAFRVGNGSLAVLQRWQSGDPDAPTALTTIVDDGSSPNDYFYARECSCFERDGDGEVTLCPATTTSCSEVINTRTALSQHSRTVACYNQSGHLLLFVASICAWTIFLVILLFTHPGRSALSFLPAKLLPCWNPMVVRLSLQYRKEFAFRLIQNHILVQVDDQRVRNIMRQELLHRARRQNGSMVAPTPPDPLPTCLKLKTTIYHPNQDASTQLRQVGMEEEEEEESNMLCAICYEALVLGDRVGALPCTHTYHVECLKMWLPRRNCCPLCQSQKVAEPIFGV